MELKVVSAGSTKGRFRQVRTGRTFASRDEVLSLRIAVRNTTDVPMPFDPVGPTDAHLPVIMHDARGELWDVYPLESVVPAARFRGTSIPPRRVIIDEIVFRPNGSVINGLTVMLSLDRYGEEGFVRFELTERFLRGLPEPRARDADVDTPDGESLAAEPEEGDDAPVEEHTEMPAVVAPPVSTTPATPAAAEPSSKQHPTASVTVYVTKSGSKYHRSGCRYLKSRIPTTLLQAKGRYSPCSVCRPPT